MAKKSSKKNEKKQNFLEMLELSEFVKKKEFKIGIAILFIFIVMLFTYSTRIGPVDLDGMDQRVEANILNNLRGVITAEVNQEYPNLNQLYREEEVQKRLQQAVDQGYYDLQGQRINIDQLIENSKEDIKSAFKADNGQTYLNAIDPYHFFKLADIYYQNGYVGDELRVDENGNEVPYLSYKLAPNGVKGSENPSFHVWLQSFLFGVNGIDENSTIGDKFSVIFTLPVLIVILTVFPIYFIIRRFSNDLFAFFGSLLLVSLGTYVSRTVAGFVDTDAYNVLFPLLISCFIVYGFTSKKDWLKYLLVGVAGFFQGMFMWAWEAGWFIFLFVVFSMLAYDGYRLAVKLIETKGSINKSLNYIIKPLTSTIIFLVSSFVFTLLFVQRNIFEVVYKGVFSSVGGISEVSASTIWPNVFSSVAELNPASFANITQTVGGGLIFLIAMAGILFLSLDYKIKNKKFDTYNRVLGVLAIVFYIAVIQSGFLVGLTNNNPFVFVFLLFIPIGIALLFSLLNGEDSSKIFLTILLSVWMAGSIYMTFNGIRFLILLGPAFAISFALGLYYVSKVINYFMSTEFKLKNEITKHAPGFLVAFLVFVVLFNPVATSAMNVSQNVLPNFDDAWYGTMYNIRDNTAEDSIITSWWDFGHFFTAVAKRGVTFDGGSQTTPQSHWVGKLLLENDERVTHDILRMITCGGNNAFDKIMEYSDDPTQGVLANKIIYETFGKSKEEKIEILRSNDYFNFNEEQINEIMQELYCDNPRDNYVITSEDMVNKAPVWAHWGMWNFSKKYIHDNYKLLPAQEISENIGEELTVVERHISELEDIDVRAQSENVKRSDLINQWFAPYPSYVTLDQGGNYLLSCRETNFSFLCVNDQIRIYKNGTIDTSQEITGGVKNLIFPSAEEGLRVIEQNPEGNFDYVLLQSTQGPRLLIAESPLGMSTFTRLFYLGGTSSDYFERFDDVTSATGTRVITWKVNWEDSFNETS